MEAQIDENGSLLATWENPVEADFLLFRFPSQFIHSSKNISVFGRLSPSSDWTKIMSLPSPEIAKEAAALSSPDSQHLECLLTVGNVRPLAVGERDRRILGRIVRWRGAAAVKKIQPAQATIEPASDGNGTAVSSHA